ncbi:MAG: TetR/AcrR family transcriptional regulator [Sediminibacterium sp.]
MKPKDDKKTHQIFQATLGLVMENGLAGVKMCEIATEAGIATGTLYIYFKNKDELINALFAACRKASIENYFKKYDPAVPFEKGFRTVWANILRYRTKEFEAAVFMDQCYHSPFINECTMKLTKQLTHPMFKLIERGKEEGFFKKADTFSLLIFMIGGIHEAAKHAHYNRKALTKKTIESMFRMCWDGLKA